MAKSSSFFSLLPSLFPLSSLSFSLSSSSLPLPSSLPQPVSPPVLCVVSVDGRVHVCGEGGGAAPIGEAAALLIAALCTTEGTTDELVHTLITERGADKTIEDLQELYAAVVLFRLFSSIFLFFSSCLSSSSSLSVPLPQCGCCPRRGWGCPSPPVPPLPLRPRPPPRRVSGEQRRTGRGACEGGGGGALRKRETARTARGNHRGGRHETRNKRVFSFARFRFFLLIFHPISPLFSPFVIAPSPPRPPDVSSPRPRRAVSSVWCAGRGSPTSPPPAGTPSPRSAGWAASPCTPRTYGTQGKGDERVSEINEGKEE